MNRENSEIPKNGPLPELSFRALGLGIVLAAVMGAANAYLALKAGQTVSATFPAAILALLFFGGLRSTLLEQNLARAAGTVGEALAAGAIFTIPAFLLVSVGGERLWTEFRYWETSLILLLGGILGVFFITLLRRPLAVEADLPFPESRACASLVQAGQRGGTGAREVFAAMGLGMVIQLLKDSSGVRLFRESLEVIKELPRSVVHHFNSSRAALGDVHHGGAVAFATPAISPALIGVGYIIGFELAAINFAGGVLAWLVFIPFAFFVDPDLVARLGSAADRAAVGEVIFSVWYNVVRPVAVGAMVMGAAKTMWGMRRSIAQAFRSFRLSGTLSSGEIPRVEQDLDSRFLFGGLAGVTLAIALLYWHFTQDLSAVLAASAAMLVLGFLLSAVGGYLVGVVGGSNQPVSGLTLSGLVLTALLLVALGVTGVAGVGAVLGVAAVICCAICVSGSLIQDLKVGQLLGATPRKMQIAEIVATVTTAFVLVFPMHWLHRANVLRGGIGIGDRELPAPQAGLMAQLAQGIVGGEMPWGLVLFGMCFSLALILMKAPSPTLIAVGMYLPFETTGAIFLGGCLRAWAERRAATRGIGADEVEQRGSLVASGLIAGESLTGVLLAGMVFATGGKGSLASWLFGVEGFAWVDGSWGALTSLVPLGLLAYFLVFRPFSRSGALFKGDF
jgi:putative OPT family oligopeptide transporter